MGQSKLLESEATLSRGDPAAAAVLFNFLPPHLLTALALNALDWLIFVGGEGEGLFSNFLYI